MFCWNTSQGRVPFGNDGPAYHGSGLSDGKPLQPTPSGYSNTTMGKTPVPCMNTIEVEVHHEKIYGMQSFAYLSTTWNYYNHFLPRVHVPTVNTLWLANWVTRWKNVAELAYGALVTCYGNRIRQRMIEMKSQEFPVSHVAFLRRSGLWMHPCCRRLHVSLEGKRSLGHAAPLLDGSCCDTPRQKVWDGRSFWQWHCHFLWTMGQQW